MLTCGAGQWEELLPLCAFQGDFAVLRSFANKAPTGSQGAYDGPLVRACMRCWQHAWTRCRMYYIRILQSLS